jgi:hypothetical protein
MIILFEMNIVSSYAMLANSPIPGAYSIQDDCYTPDEYPIPDDYHIADDCHQRDENYKIRRVLYKNT